MIIKVLLFASIREIVGADSINITVDPGATISVLLNVLESQYPEVKPLIPHCIIASNLEYIYNRNEIILEDDEIAIIPPLSGG